MYGRPDNPKFQPRAPRASHDSVAEIFSSDGKLLDCGRLVDFSNTGAGFFSLKPLKQGDKLRLRVRLLEKGVLDISAQVVRVVKEGAGNVYGLKFDSVRQVFPTGEIKKPFE